MEIKQRVLSRSGSGELKTLAELVTYISAEESAMTKTLRLSAPDSAVKSPASDNPATSLSQVQPLRNVSSVAGPGTLRLTLLRTDRDCVKLLERSARLVRSPTTLPLFASLAAEPRLPLSLRATSSVPSLWIISTAPRPSTTLTAVYTRPELRISCLWSA